MKQKNSSVHILKVVYFGLLMLGGILILNGSAAEEKIRIPRWKIINPYQDVNWEKDGRYKANLHTHTSQSDGRHSPREVVEAYAKLGYKILALTDHDVVTWPWEKFDIQPGKMGILAIIGNEISQWHDFCSLFNDYQLDSHRGGDERTVLTEIGKRGGIAFFNHPGRYNQSVEWYVGLFLHYPYLVGIEICNQNNRYPQDPKIWDAILTKCIEDRPIWGLANDDMHSIKKHLGYSWNIFLLAELTLQQVREALEKGKFFYAYTSGGHEGPMPPEIQKIQVDETLGVIELMVTESSYSRIEWISEGKVVGIEPQIRVNVLQKPKTYLRAVVYNQNDRAWIGTQPFRIIQDLEK